MKMASSMMAMQRQAGDWIAATKAAMAAAGLGFSDDDLAAIAASHAAHPVPEVPVAGGEVDVAEMTRRAMEADYPEGGFPADDPRLAPVEGISLAVHAIAAKAIGWSTDPADTARVVAALGLDPEVFARSTAEWTRRVTDDIVLAAFYGQLFAQA